MSDNTDREVDPAALPDGGPTDGHDEHLMDHHRDVVSPGIEVSPDTTVTSAEPATGEPAEPSPARPDELVERGHVGDGTELE